MWLRDLVQVRSHHLTLVFESFAFKHGVPLDADLVFDVRVLPNPHYEPDLRPLTGRDAPVVAFLQTHPEVGEMLGQIEAFVTRWLPNFEADHRSYLTVGDRLHRRPAPLGLHGRDPGAPPGRPGSGPRAASRTR